jgi:hypothetical protein
MIIMASGEVDSIKNCANPECRVEFIPTRHNQKYHSKECCKVVTNAKIMQQYYEKKDRKSGKRRICKSCRVTPLSRYNEGNKCQSCVLAERAANRLELLQLVGAA